MFADVTSANTVGYTAKGSIEKDKFYILAGQFEGVAGGKKVNDVLGAVTGVDYGDGKTFLTTASQIQIPNSEGSYDLCWYLNDGYYEDEQGQEAYKPGWCNDGGNLVDVEIPDGVSFWFKNKQDTDSTWTHSGAVPGENAKRIEYPTGFALRSNPFPVAFKLNSDALDCSEVVGVDYGNGKDFLTTATQIQVPNSEGSYDLCWYLNDGYYEDEQGQEAYKPGWCNDGGNLVDLEIPVMQGFWTKGVSGAAAITFKLAK